MLNTTPHPVLHPSTSTISLASQHVQEPSIALPPPTSSKVPTCHQRSRTTVDLPPLATQTRTPSASPTRSSTFLPFLRHTRGRSISPERVTAKEAAEFDVGLTPPEEIADPTKASGKVGKLASWFEGTSDPVNIALVSSPTKEKSNPIPEVVEMERMFSNSTESVDTYTKRPQKRPTLYTNPEEGSTSRFSFFRKSSQAQLPSAPVNVDELIEQDPFTALFPSGQSDVFSPAAYKNLQINAEGTIRRFQDALRKNSQALKSMTSQKNVQKDELEAARTQNEHLKMQLTEMAEAISDKEDLIAALRAELASRPVNFQADSAPKRSLRLVSRSSEATSHQFESPQSPVYRRKRVSDTSTLNESENGSEQSSAVSVFSDAGSGFYSPGTSIAPSPVLKHAIMLNGPSLRPSPMHEGVRPIQVLDCQKCHGVERAEAWDVIGMMKIEKIALRERIEQLEGAQDGALDILSGLSLS